MNIFTSLFGAPAAQQTQQQQQVPPGNFPVNSASTANGNPAVPPEQQQQQQQQQQQAADPTKQTQQQTEQKSPLDEFASLWQTDDKQQTPEALLNVDPKQLAEAARKTDFSKLISQDQLAAIAKGGEDAVGAFVQAMNNVAQGVYAQAAFASSRISEQAAMRMQERLLKELPTHVKQFQSSESLRTQHPIVSHPAAAPVIDLLSKQIALKYPDATSGEITAMAQRYLTNLAAIDSNSSNSNNSTQSSQKGGNDTDWENFLSGV